MIGIYKIENKINNHIYIGASNNIEKRWKNHKIRSVQEESKEYEKPLYRAFRKYGIDNFNFTILEECSQEELFTKEIDYIKQYNSYYNGYNQTPGGEGFIDQSGEKHPNHKLTKKDIIDIRHRYNNLERKNEVYDDYKTRIGESGFAKIWKGETWKNILPEVYTLENKNFHGLNTGNIGSKNGRARLDEEDVYKIRLRRKEGENIKIVYQDYQDKLTYGSFVNVWSYQNWKNIVV